MQEIQQETEWNPSKSSLTSRVRSGLDSKKLRFRVENVCDMI
jgi:hypothetical protein